jgi:hypothetical protein
MVTSDRRFSSARISVAQVIWRCGKRRQAQVAVFHGDFMVINQQKW